MLYCTGSPIFTKNGHYYAQGLSSIIRNYFNSFGKLDVICSTKPYIEGLNYNDVTEYLKNVYLCEGHFRFLSDKKLRNFLLAHIPEEKLIICRFPSLLAAYVGNYAIKRGKKVLSEVAGCGWDAMWYHSIKGKLLAPFVHLSMKRIIQRSNYVLYVTQEYLQRKYPSNTYKIGISNVNIQPNSSINEKEIFLVCEKIKRQAPVFFTTGAVDTKYKGQQYVIRAIAQLKMEGYNPTYYIIGGGNQQWLRQIAKKNGVQNDIVFTGRLDFSKIVKIYKIGGIYIQPSLTEGLPRALVEAMSQGLPCIGSDAGGIPELLQKDCIFKAGNVKSLISVLKNLLNSDLHMISKRNLQQSKNYYHEILSEKRKEFYKNIKNNL